MPILIRFNSVQFYLYTLSQGTLHSKAETLQYYREGGEKKIPFDRKKPPTEPDSVWMASASTSWSERREMKARGEVGGRGDEERGEACNIW